MPRPCSICTAQDAEHEAIDLDLVAGNPVTRVAAKFGVSADAVSRHFAHHVRPGAVRAQAAVQARTERQQAHDLDILAELRHRLERADRLGSIAEGLVGRAVGEQDLRTAVSGVSAATRALNESRACLELLGELEGKLDRRPQVNVLVTAEWQDLVAALRRILAPYPPILAEVSSALVALEATHVRAA